MGGNYVNTVIVSTATYNVKDTDYYISVHGPVGLQCTLNLPKAGKSKGRVLIISNKLASSVVMNDNGVQAINGSDSSAISENHAEIIICDGTKWYNLINF